MKRRYKRKRTTKDRFRMLTSIFLVMASITAAAHITLVNPNMTTMELIKTFTYEYILIAVGFILANII